MKSNWETSNSDNFYHYYPFWVTDIKTKTTTDIIYPPVVNDNSYEIENLKKELKENKEIIKKLEKLLNDFIDDPEKVKRIRKIDPYGEEDWEK